MGIVTWASVKCQVLPEVHKLFLVASQKLGDLIDFVYRVQKFRFGDELLILNSANLASILGNRPDEIQALRQKMPAWVVIVGVTGGSVLPQERVNFQENDIREIAKD
jgi:hypothetical protein